MVDSPEASNLPAQIASAVVGIPKALIPTSLKALDRLISAGVDIPVAWLAQRKAKIEAQTEAYKAVETSIAKAAADLAGADQDTVERAMAVLVRKEYRKQTNREAVAAAMIDDLHDQAAPTDAQTATPNPADLDDDWLNVFERYAEDASTERMQKLWGRVLAGEVRKPGRYSIRTLLFLSEFSQADALAFADFSKYVFRDSAVKSWVNAMYSTDLRPIAALESSGLIQGLGMNAVNMSFKIDDNGNTYISEGPMILWLRGKPRETITEGMYLLTPLAIELLSLLPDRDLRLCAKSFAKSIRTSDIHSACIAVQDENFNLIPIEVLWDDRAQSS